MRERGESSLVEPSLSRQLPEDWLDFKPRLYITKDNLMKQKTLLGMAALIALTVAGCTQESQNKLGRSLQNWTGTNGVLEVYAGDKLVRRFMRIDKLSTASGTSSDIDRPYRFGYGVMDSNLNEQVDEGEKKVYFEISDYSTSYVFFESPE